MPFAGDVPMQDSGRRRERFARVRTSPAVGFGLIAGEEARSRETGENPEMAARHLVPLGAALRDSDRVRTGDGDEGGFHGPVPLG